MQKADARMQKAENSWQLAVGKQGGCLLLTPSVKAQSVFLASANS
jgi:hypothetical protein